MEKLYENIKRLRKELGMSQDDLAKKTGYTDRSSISKIEAGEVDLQQSKIALFAKALGTTYTDLVGWGDTKFDIFVTYTYDDNDPQEVRTDQLERLAAYRALFERLSKLSDGERARIMKLINDMLDTFEESKNISAGSDTETT